MNDHLDRMRVQHAINTCFSDLNGDPMLAQRIKNSMGNGMKDRVNFSENCANPKEQSSSNILIFRAPSSEEKLARKK